MEPITSSPAVSTHDAPDDATTGTPQSCLSSPVDDEAETDVESEDEAYVNASRGNAKAAAPPPTPYVVPQAASSDDEEIDAPVELLADGVNASAAPVLFRAEDTVFARDGREEHPATVVADCPAGAATVRIKWESTRQEVEVAVAGVTAIGDLPQRSCRKPRAAAVAAARVAVDEDSEADEPAEDEAPSPDAAGADAFRPLTPLARPSCVPPPSLSSPAEPDCLACATGDRRRKHTCGAAVRLRNAGRSKPKPAKKSVHAWRLDDDELAEDAPAPRRSGRARTKVATYATEENDVPKRAARKRRAAANDRSPFKSGANVFGF